MPYADLLCSVEAVTGDDLLAEAFISPATPTGLRLDMETDATVDAAARPRAGTVQRCGVEFRVAGVAVSLEDMVEAWSVSRSYDQAKQQWQFSVALQNAIGPLGSPFAVCGPPTAKKAIDIYGIYETSTGVHFVGLIRNGIADNSERSGGPGGYIETTNGVDAGGRYDRKAVTLVLPPGHGLPRGRVVELLAAGADVTETSLEPGRTMVKEIQAVDADWLALSQEIEEVENRRLLWDRQAALINPKVGKPSESAVLTIEEQDILAIAQVTIQHQGDVVTDVTVVGSEQVTSPGDEICGDEVKTYRAETDTAWAPHWLVGRQETSCTITAMSVPSIDAEVRLTGLQITKLTFRCGTLILEETETWGYYNPLAARYRWAAAATLNCRGGVYTDGLANDSDMAYLQRYETWKKIAESKTWHYYDEDNYRGPQTISGLDAVANHFSGPWTAGYTGTRFKLGSVTESKAYYLGRRALKQAQAGIAWEAIDPTVDVYALGNGEGVSGGGSTTPFEELILTSREVELLRATDDGFVESRDLYRQRYLARPGSDWWFSGGYEAAEENEAFQLAEWERTVYIQTGESNTLVENLKFNSEGALVGGTRENTDGGPPAVERLPEDESDAGLYESTEEQTDLEQKAKRGETREIKVQIIADGLEEFHEKREVKTSMPWAENIQELEEAARAIIEESAAAAVKVTLPANFLVKERDVIRVKYRPLGLDHEVRIRRVGWMKSGPADPITTQLECMLYGW